MPAPRGVRGHPEDEHGQNSEIQAARDGEGGVIRTEQTTMNIEKYRKDIEKLVRNGKLLMISMALELNFDLKTDLDKDQLKNFHPFRKVIKVGIQRR